jgi:hypothetical protein
MISLDAITDGAIGTGSVGSTVAGLASLDFGVLRGSGTAVAIEPAAASAESQVFTAIGTGKISDLVPKPDAQVLLAAAVGTDAAAATVTTVVMPGAAISADASPLPVAVSSPPPGEVAKPLASMPTGIDGIKVTEPGSLALLGAGLFALLLARRRRDMGADDPAKAITSGTDAEPCAPECP